MKTNLWQDNLFVEIAAQDSILLQDPRSGLQKEKFSGHEFLDICIGWGKHFGGLNIACNTPILIPMRVGIQSVATLFGALYAGLFPILVKPATPANLVVETIEGAGGGLLVVPASMMENYLQKSFVQCGPNYAGYSVLITPAEPLAHPDVEGGSIVGILSSGSTGRPKVIVQTLKNVMQNAKMHAASIGLTASDTVVLSLPLNFSSGLVAGLFGTLLTGANGIFVDVQRVNPRKFLADIPVTVCMGTPGSILSVFGEEILGRINTLTVGGDVLHPQLALQLLEQLVLSGKVYATYGMTEAGPRIASALLTPEIVRKYGAVPLGQPLDGVRLSLELDSFVSKTGELIVETPTAMHSYLYDSSGSRQVMDASFGKVRTGDIFRQEDDEYIFIGRKKRIIVRGGENIYPAFIESKILNLYDLEDVWVTSELHNELGEVPKAYLLSHRPIDLNKLSKELRQHLPTSHIPVSWEVVKALPQGARK